jgi:hypothetical protein
MLHKALLMAALSLAAYGQPEAGVAIRVVEGDGAINSIRLHRGHDPVVRVLDPTGEPIAGAIVTFLLPSSGPGGTFGDSGLSLTIQTDAQGMAVGRGLRPNRIAGQFRIRATTSWHNQAASASLTETNAEPLAQSHTSRTIAIVVIAAAAVAGGAAAASHGGKSSAATNAGAATAPPATITAGAPSFGPPN